MKSDTLELLCTGDIHLGRHPTRIPETLDGQSFSPRAVWRSTVDHAIGQDVDGVLISGDIIDRENRYFEAYGAFEEGATRLNEAAIPTLVVAGNHDFDSLPQLVGDLDLEHLHLVGANGTWERHTISVAGEPRFHVDGWSFPREHVLESPLDDYDLGAAEEPVIGLAHVDFEGRDSDYAPVERQALEATPVDAWLLGHIHTPGVRIGADPTVFYPGSPQALDPGEQGTHGPWMIRSDSRGIDLEQLPFASARYDHLEVDVSDIDDTREVASLVKDRIDGHITTNVPTESLELLSTRVDLTGRTSAHGEFVDQQDLIEDQLEFKVGSLPVRVDELTVNTTPAIDLEDVAEDDSPVGYLADLLLSLEDNDIDTHGQLIEDATEALREVHTAGAYQPLRREGRLSDPTTEDAIDLLERQGRLLLYELLEQTEGEA